MIAKLAESQCEYSSLAAVCEVQRIELEVLEGRNQMAEQTMEEQEQLIASLREEAAGARGQLHSQRLEQAKLIRVSNKELTRVIGERQI